MSLSMPVSPAGSIAHEVESLRRIWWLVLIFGLVSVIVGMMAISSTFVATEAIVVIFGVLLTVVGVTEVIHAFMVRTLSSFALHVLAAAVYLMGGLFILEHPVKAAAVLTLLFAASFLVGGSLRIIFALSNRFPAWPWVLLNGVIDLLLGFLIWREWPESSLWVIGLFFGIDLLFHGWSWIFLALSVRSAVPPPQPA